MPVSRKSDEPFGGDIGSFEKEIESPENLLADDILGAPKARAASAPNTSSLGGAKTAQKIPAFVSLTKYRELRLALREMKNISAEMRRILADLKANRDGGTGLLDETVSGLEGMDANIDKVKAVLRV